MRVGEGSKGYNRSKCLDSTRLVHGTAAFKPSAVQVICGCGYEDESLGRGYTLSSCPDFYRKVSVHLRAWEAVLGLRVLLASRFSRVSL